MHVIVETSSGIVVNGSVAADLHQASGPWPLFGLGCSALHTIWNKASLGSTAWARLWLLATALFSFGVIFGVIRTIRTSCMLWLPQTKTSLDS